MFCKNCGARIDDGSLFCGECGAKQVEETAASAPAAAPVAPPPAPVTPVAPVAPVAPAQSNPYQQPYQAPAQPAEPAKPAQPTYQQPYQAPSQPTYQQPVQQPYGGNQFNQQQQPQYNFQPPKKSKGPMIAIICGAAVLVVVLIIVLVVVLSGSKGGNSGGNGNGGVTPSVTTTENTGGNPTVTDPTVTDAPITDAPIDDYNLADEFMGIWQYGSDTYVQINYATIVIINPGKNTYKVYKNELNDSYLVSDAFGGRCTFTFSSDKYTVTIHPEEAGKSDVTLDWIGNLYDSDQPAYGVWENANLDGEVLFICENGYICILNSTNALEGTYTATSTRIYMTDTDGNNFTFSSISFEDDDDIMYLTLNDSEYTFNRIYY